MYYNVRTFMLVLLRINKERQSQMHWLSPIYPKFANCSRINEEK